MTTSSSRSVYNELLEAERHARKALDGLDESTEYLRDELEDQLGRLHILLEKMDCDRALTRDRDYLQALDPPEEGLSGWLGGTDG